MTNLAPEERDELFRQARIQARSGRKSGWLSVRPHKGEWKLRVGWRWSVLASMLAAVGLAALLGSAVTLDLARLSETTTVAIDGTAWDIMVHAQFVGDKIGLESLEANGQIFTLEEGTRVRIIGIGLTGAKVLVLSGYHTGRTGWVHRNYLSR